MTAQISSYPFAKIYTSRGYEIFYITRIKRLQDIFFLELASSLDKKIHTWIIQQNWPPTKEDPRCRYVVISRIMFFKRTLLPDNDLSYFYNSDEKQWAAQLVPLLKTMKDEEERSFDEVG